MQTPKGLFLPNAKWIRGYLGGHLVVDSRDVLGVWDHRHYPSWYFPVQDLDATLTGTGGTRDVPGLGIGHIFDLAAHGHTAPSAAMRFDAAAAQELADRVRIDFGSLDRWFEEDVEVFSEPRNPYVRVDALRTSRHVLIRLGDTVVADTTSPVVLFETNVNPRYYVPMVDVDLTLFSKSAKTSSCPYKGFASYWTLEHDGQTLHDVAWSYQSPFAEAVPVASMMSFYTNRLDVQVDGRTVTT